MHCFGRIAKQFQPIEWCSSVRPSVCVTSTFFFTFALMKSHIPLKTAAIFFLANLLLKQSISSEYAMVDFIGMGKLWLQGAKTENYKMKNSYP